MRHIASEPNIIVEDVRSFVHTWPVGLQRHQLHRKLITGTQGRGTNYSVIPSLTTCSICYAGVAIVQKPATL